MLILPPIVGWLSALIAAVLFVVITMKTRGLRGARLFDVAPVLDYEAAKSNRDGLAKPHNKAIYRSIIPLDLAMMACLGVALYCWITLSAEAAGIAPQPWMALLVGAGVAFDLFEDMVGLYVMQSTRVFDRRTASRLAVLTSIKFVGYAASIATALVFTFRLVG